MRKAYVIVSILMIFGLAVAAPRVARAQASDLRYALVIGNAQYHDKPLVTAANDAGLIADTLRVAGFDVTGAADLDQDSVRRAFKDFLSKLQEAGPHAIAFIYLAGYGLQYDGDNYFIPVDAFLQHASDIPIEAVKVSDFTQALASVTLQARIFVLDAARDNTFPTNGGALALGLALPDVDPGSLYALNAAPGTVAPVERGTYGAYAQALAEMLRYGGVPMNDVFARTRLRVNEITHGAFTPWDMSKLTSPLVLFAADSDAQVLDALEAYSDLQGESIHDFTNATDAYAAAAELDTLASYQEFLAAFPSDPLCARVQALLARRREALTWSQARRVHRPNAYWSYMQRYPDGPHAADAQRLLIALSAQVQPPARFEPFDFQGLPPPAEEERGILEQGDFGRGGPHYAPVPPLSLRFLPPLPQQFRHLPPPEERAQGQLPVPLPIPLAYARPAARLGNLAAPNFQPQPPAEPVAPDHGAGHGVPNPNERLGNERLGNERLGNERSGNTRLGNERTGEEPTHAESPRVEVRPPPKAPPSGHFEVAPHPAAPMRPAGEAR